MRFRKLRSELKWIGQRGSDIYGYFVEEIDQNDPYDYPKRFHAFWGKADGQKMFYTYEVSNWIENSNFWNTLRRKKRDYASMNLEEVSRGYKLALKKDYEYHLLMRRLKNAAV